MRMKEVRRRRPPTKREYFVLGLLLLLHTAAIVVPTFMIDERNTPLWQISLGVIYVLVVTPTFTLVMARVAEHGFDRKLPKV